jgi:hypothetical protein
MSTKQDSRDYRLQNEANTGRKTVHRQAATESACTALMLDHRISLTRQISLTTSVLIFRALPHAELHLK